MNVVVPIRTPPPANPVDAEFIRVLARMVADAVVRDIRDRDERLRPEASPGTARPAENVRELAAPRQAGNVTRLFIKPRRKSA